MWPGVYLSAELGTDYEQAEIGSESYPLCPNHNMESPHGFVLAIGEI
jgi:hypothetical protein